MFLSFSDGFRLDDPGEVRSCWLGKDKSNFTVLSGVA
jgi:hypothetical protein